MTKDDLKRVPELYRAAMLCKIGRDALDGATVPVGVTPTKYPLFCLLKAVEEIAEHLAKQPLDAARRT